MVFCFYSARFQSPSGDKTQRWSTHVEPFARWFACLRLGAESQHVAVKIFHLHLVRPRIIRGCVPDFGSGGSILVQQRIGVVNSNPRPIHPNVPDRHTTKRCGIFRARPTQNMVRPNQV
jgi:hypothetical protein